MWLGSGSRERERERERGDIFVDFFGELRRNPVLEHSSNFSRDST
jgi:hypothetical protein